MRAVIFDLDGTLCDSAPDLRATANALLRSMGYQPLSLEIIRSFIGNGVPTLVKRVMVHSDIEFTKERHAEMTETFEKLYSANPVALTVLYPGVRDALDMLQRRGFVMGVCTNKAHGITLQVLDGLKISQYFKAVVGGDSLPTRKPEPAMLQDCAKQLGCDDVWYVGDSEVDSETAVAADIRFSLFTNGYRKSPVSEIAHTTRFSTFADLAGFLAAVNEKTVTL
ncbi:MAG: phosphoglycolate phosphatase [Paracoccaceae bacterium]|jgi:phosphoglycolate phosphatase